MALTICFIILGCLLIGNAWCFLSVVVITCASHAQGRRFEPGRKQASLCYAYDSFIILSEHSLSCYLCQGFHGVMVSTLDFESSDPSSNLGGTWLTPWRNGSASDSRSEGCVFESRRGQHCFAVFNPANRSYRLKDFVPPMRIELMTFGLQDQRSATEL